MKAATQRERDRAEKKVQIAVDKMIDLNDMGFGCDETERVLEKLRHLEHKVQYMEKR